MQKKIDIVLTPKQASSKENILAHLSEMFKISLSKISYLKILRKSIDARSKNIKVNLRVWLVYDEKAPELKQLNFVYPNVKDKEKIIIIGAGPAGLFAGLQAIEMGLCPIILERGKSIEERRKDIKEIYRSHEINENSNYAFGEGGAGTFSDGKLHTRSKKRGNIENILETFVFHGAKEDILYENHAHIGTDKLPKIIENIRNTIINSGGEVHFNTKLEDFIIEEKLIKKAKVRNLETNELSHFTANHFILATGHSARDIYELLHRKNILLEEKSFSVGVRVEHLQSLIDTLQYHTPERDEHLPPAEYRLVQQIKGRGVYSFCMCPGGSVVPASTKNKQIVVNGMSSEKRSSKFANAGIVVEVKEEDLKKFKDYGVLAGVKFQEYLESLAFEKVKKGQVAPAQRLMDFVENKPSKDLPENSYSLGLTLSPIHEWLPKNIRFALQKGFIVFEKKMRNFLTNDAIIIGVETRTSSPVRIPRDKITLQHLQIKNLYPCGEGAGYSGGIVSSAIDGQRCVKSIADKK